MTDYKKLVEALRHCGKDLMPGERCKDSCPYGDIALCLPKLKLDAAAVIEDMAKHITEMHERVTVLQIARGELEAEVKRLEPKLGEWYTELYDGDKKYQCSNCLTHWDVETRYCPFCGAKMREVKA